MPQRIGPFLDFEAFLYDNGTEHQEITPTIYVNHTNLQNHHSSFKGLVIAQIAVSDDGLTLAPQKWDIGN